MSEKVGLKAKTEKKAKDSSTSKPKENFYEPMDSPVEQIFHLQRTIGNQDVQRLIKSGAIQAKLTIGQPNDKYEQEADRMADRVMRMLDSLYTYKGNRVLSNESSPVSQQKAGQGLKKNLKKRGIVVNLHHGNPNIINRSVFAQDRRTRTDFGRLYSTRDVRVLRFRRGRRPYQILYRRRPGPFDDTFRVGLIREIINSSSEILLLRLSMSSNSPPHDLYRNGQLVSRNLTTPLSAMAHGMASGVHIPDRALALAHPGYTGPVSRVANRSYVAYQDPLSLGHELFGHHYLAIKGSPFGHGSTVPATANIRNPDGTIYSGPTNRFISEFTEEKRYGLRAGRRGGPLISWRVHFSPTRILSWPTPQGGTIRVTYLQFKRRYPRAIITVRGRRRIVIF